MREESVVRDLTVNNPLSLDDSVSCAITALSCDPELSEDCRVGQPMRERGAPAPQHS